jgi:hypothetical protein
MIAAGSARAAQPAPDPASSDYLTVAETLSANTESFNHATRRTRQVEIVGMTVVLDPDTPLNGLFTTYDNQPDIKTLRIYADTLILRGRLRLPQTDVWIVAKNVIFENPGGTADGTQLITTPLSLTGRPLPEGAGIAGAHGLKAGDARVFTNAADIPASIQSPFVLRGGDGQPAGLGRDGADGDGMDAYDGDLSLPSSNAWPEGTVWIWRLASGLNRQTMFGADDWPEDGEDAVPPGKPGNGGDGGSFHFRGDTDFTPSLIGGPAGAVGAATSGGAVGEPINAVHVQYVEDLGNRHYVTREENASVPGADGPAPQAGAPIGNGGVTLNAGEAEPYMHPKVLAAVHGYAADLVATGHLNDARLWTETYLAIYAAYKLTVNWTDLPQADKNAAETQMAQLDVLLARIADNAAEDWRNYF